MIEIDDYIGDGVYVHFDGFGIELRANDHSNPTDKIYLEPEVFSALIRFVKFNPVMKEMTGFVNEIGHTTSLNQISFLINEYKNMKNLTIKMKSLLIEMLPDMEARVVELRERWPAKDVLTALHRNERFVEEIRDLIGD